jgi:hypothetical protein
MTDSIISNSKCKDNELRILIFTATYFVLDGVTLTIRRLESHLRSRGATVKVCTTVGDDVSEEQLKDVIVVPGIKVPFSNAGAYAIGLGLDKKTIQQIEEYKPNCVHFTVPDFVAIDGIKWCQRNNIAYIGTKYIMYLFLHSSYGEHQYLISYICRNMAF